MFERRGYRVFRSIFIYIHVYHYSHIYIYIYLPNITYSNLLPVSHKTLLLVVASFSLHLTHPLSGYCNTVYGN
jgi:hypothetical protein